MMEAAVHKRNLESSILFMQQEHATTLKALHEEIHKLQKRCTDLTFQLTMHGISVEDEDDADCSLQEVQQQLQQSQEQESGLQGQLQEGELQLQELQQETRQEQRRHVEEMRQATQTISSLRAEVEAKANNIAFLTTELHRLKVRHKAGEGGGAGGAGSGSGSGSGQGLDLGLALGPTLVSRTQPQYSHLPVPPPRDRFPASNTATSARLRQRGAQSLPSPSARRGVVMAGAAPAPTPTIGAGSLSGAEAEALARSLRVTSASTRSSGGSESPDISPFVHRDPRPALPAMVEPKKTPAPLPPIAGSHHLGLGGRDPPLNKADLQQVMVAKRGRPAAGVAGVSRHHPPPRGSTPEVTTLAVDQVSDANWKRPSEPHSSEYN